MRISFPPRTALAIQFTTDLTVEQKGYSAIYRMIECELLPTTTPSFTTPPGVTCDRVFQDVESFITSVNFPLAYPKNLDCIYRIDKAFPVIINQFFLIPKFCFLQFLTGLLYRRSASWKFISWPSTFKKAPIARPIVWRLIISCTVANKQAEHCVYHLFGNFSKCAFIPISVSKTRDSTFASGSSTSKTRPLVTFSVPILFNNFFSNGDEPITESSL